MGPQERPRPSGGQTVDQGRRRHAHGLRPDPWLFSNPQVSLFGAFGSFALLLLVDFPGPTRTRLLSYVALVLVGGAFIAVGTAASTYEVAAVVAMAVVGFCVLFLGIVSPQVATASTAALLLFVLPVAVAQPAAAIGPRLLGWAFAAAFCVTACMVVWPTPWHDNLRRRLSATLSAVAQLADAHLHGGSVAEANATVESEVGQLRRQLAGTPYPATGAAGPRIALAKLVGRVEWVAGNAALSGASAPLWRSLPVRVMIETVAETLRRCAALICDGTAHPVHDPVRVSELQESSRRLAQLVDAEVDYEVSSLIDLMAAGSMQTIAAEGQGAEDSRRYRLLARPGLPGPDIGLLHQHGGGRHPRGGGCRRRRRSGIRPDR